MLLPVLSEFSKGCPGSVAVNFSTSGGCNCDKACRFHPESVHPDATYSCYAARAERTTRPEAHTRYQRHERLGAAAVAAAAKVGLQKKRTRVPWLRISAFGSVPMPKDAKPAFLAQMHEIFAWTASHGVKVHFPVESLKKTVFYRKHFPTIVVRQSCQTLSEFMHADGPSAYTAGTPAMTRVQRVWAAKYVARQRAKKSGRKTVLCPAIVASWANPGQTKAKCGNCTACAEHNVDVVYCLH